MRSRGSLWMLLGLAVAAYFGHRWLAQEYFRAGPTTETVRIEVAPGTSARGVLAQLGERGVLRSPRTTETYLRLHAHLLQIKAGAYDIPARASPAQVIRQLEHGDVVLEHLTVVEGSTFADLRRTLERHPGVKARLRGQSDAAVMAAIGHAGEFPEGRFFPDTYRFAAKTTDVEILRLAYNKMQKLIDEAWAQRRENLPVRNPYEALTLASLVEKETALPAERRRIAGVFTERLRLGMRLQSDPTVIYGIGEKYDGDIRTQDLSTDTPYNTYTRAGLPPTPIALPGRDSLFAAVQPEETGALFFVATGDGTGAHHFSKTLAEHNAAVQRMLVRQRRGQNQRGS